MRREEGTGHDAEFFFVNDTATTEIYTLSLHDALPISGLSGGTSSWMTFGTYTRLETLLVEMLPSQDRKSTRLNSSHANISYAVFCLKKITTDPIFLIPIHGRLLLPASGLFVIMSF